MRRDSILRIASIVEIAIAIVVIALDLLSPTLVILALAALSLVFRRDTLASLGFKRPKTIPRTLLWVLALVIAWSLIELALIIPALNHITGTTQDLGAFKDLKGNLGELLLFLALTWSLAAFGEEIVYRGYLQKRIAGLFGSKGERSAGLGLAGSLVAIGATSLLFGLAHTEQGIVGVAITTLDALFWSIIKRSYGDNLWTTIFAHGASNSIGLITFFFVGPIAGFW